MTRPEIEQRIDRLYPRLDYRLRELLIEFAEKAEKIKPERYAATSETAFETAAARFLTGMFDESDRPEKLRMSPY